MSDDLARRADQLRDQVDNMRKAEKEGSMYEPYSRLPEHMQAGARRYVEEGRLPGDFLQAVLRNDLVGSLGTADHINSARIMDFATWLRWDIPSECWGSQEIVDAWVESHRLAREAS